MSAKFWAVARVCKINQTIFFKAKSLSSYEISVSIEVAQIVKVPSQTFKELYLFVQMI
jgi:hypothetical protein